MQILQLKEHGVPFIMSALMVDVTVDIPTMLTILIDQDRLSGDRNICEIFIIICTAARMRRRRQPGHVLP